MILLEDIKVNLRDRGDPIMVALPGRHEIFVNEIVHLVGENGSGKTTLLQLIAGIHQNYVGSFTMPMDWRVRYIPTNVKDLFLPWYSLEQNAQIFVNTLQDPNNGLSCFCDYLSRFMGDKFSRIMKQPPYSLSAGEQAASALACALATKPNVLLLDETFSCAYWKLAQRMAEAISDYRDRNQLVLVYADHQENPINESARIIDVAS